MESKREANDERGWIQGLNVDNAVILFFDYSHLDYNNIASVPGIPRLIMRGRKLLTKHHVAFARARPVGK